MRINITKLRYLSLLPLLWSCSGASPETYEKAAQEICNCMKSEEASSDESAPMDLSYAICTQKSELKYKIDVTDKNFENALNENCPEFLKIHLRLTQNSISL